MRPPEGNVGIGTTAPNAPLQVSRNINASSFNGLKFFNKDGNNSSVSCDSYCTTNGANWGTAGTCVSAKRGENNAHIACSTTHTPDHQWLAVLLFEFTSGVLKASSFQKSTGFKTTHSTVTTIDLEVGVWLLSA